MVNGELKSESCQPPDNPPGAECNGAGGTSPGGYTPGWSHGPGGSCFKTVYADSPDAWSGCPPECQQCNVTLLSTTEGCPLC